VAYFADLTPYAYGHADRDVVGYGRRDLRYRPRYERLNVGWLDAAQPFDRGPVPDWFAGALLDATGRPPVNVYRGLHPCSFCPPGAGTIADPRRAGTGRPTTSSGCRPAPA
jgi:hypothetical protein